MTWHGYKNTMTAAAPVAVIADTDIIAKAPLYLSLSGVGDMLGKFISLAEWKMATLLTGEYFCKKIYDITLDATNAVLESADRLASGDTDAYEKLIYGLLMSGLAMQLLGSSRCASGAEHHISHMIEMSPPRLECDSHALHGQKVGVATLLVAREYHRIKDERPRFGDYKKATDEYIKEIFGDKLCDSTIAENANDAADGITAKQIEQSFDEICKIIDEIPSFDELVRLYKKLGVKSTLSDIGVGEDKIAFLLDNSPIVRNRLTLMRLRRAI
jgi:glycerol-1-phosphate dehydrogenase [NAD(P)+]